MAPTDDDRRVTPASGRPSVQQRATPERRSTVSDKRASTNHRSSVAARASVAARDGAPEDDEEREGEDDEDNGEDLDEEEDEEEEDDGEGTAQALLGSIVDANEKAVAGFADADAMGEGRKDSDTGEQVEDGLMDDLQSTLKFLADENVPLAGGAGDGATADGGAAGQKMRQDYVKLHKLFMQSRANEQALIKKCKDITTELGANSAKVQAALKLAQNDRAQIAALKKEVRKAWKMVEIGNEKENRAKEAIARLKMDLESSKRSQGGEDGGDESISITVNGVGGAGASGGGYNKLLEQQITQEETINRLKKEKEQALEQLDIALQDKKVLTAETEDLNQKITSLIADRGAADQDMQSLKELLSTKKADQDREQRAREKVEASLRQVNDIAQRREFELAQRVSEIKQLREGASKLEALAKEERAMREREMREREAANARAMKLQSELEDRMMITTRLQSDNDNKAVELKGWEEEMDRYKEEYRAKVREREALLKRIKSLEDAKREAEVERDNLRGINHSLTHEHETINREVEAYRKSIENLTRERDIAQKNFVKATGATQKQLNAFKLAEQTKRNLDHEIMGYKDEAGKMRKLIFALEKDRDRHINEASSITQNLVSKEEEIKIKEMMIFDSRKKIGDLERKLKEQQSLYENVRADRNLYSKNLIESQDEITEMKRKLKIMSHQIEQLKEEISSKESSLDKERTEHVKLEKDKEVLSEKIAKLVKANAESQQTILNQTAEENKLRHIISEADVERVRQRKEYDTIVVERDILGTQLIRRNDELSLLYEKIKIQTSTLNKGEIQYRERLEDIRVLKLEIKKLRREKAILQTETQNVDGLRNEIFRLQREVLRERTRVKVLEEELESPMNIHRWRKLSGSDPSTYELITKIQTLQKRLIAKTEEVVEKELVIGQKEKLYKEIKEVLQRQPGPEVVEELRVVKEAVKTKVRECKSLASELNMYHSQVNEYKYEIERLNRDLQALKKRYFEQKKRDREDQMGRLQLERGAPAGVVSERLMGGGADLIRAHPPSGPKFSGGGFNMTLPPRSAPAPVTPPEQEDRADLRSGGVPVEAAA